MTNGSKWANTLLIISASALLTLFTIALWNQGFVFGFSHGVDNFGEEFFGYRNNGRFVEFNYNSLVGLIIRFGFFMVAPSFIAALLIKKFPIACLFTALVSGIIFLFGIILWSNLGSFYYVIIIVLPALLGLIASGKLAYDEFLGG